MNNNSTAHYKKITPVLVFLLFLMVHQSHGQRVQISHDDYMQAINLQDDHLVMQNILLHGLQLREPGKPAEHYQQKASFFSMILLLSGVTPLHFYRLEENGIDVINAITSGDRPFSEQSLLADLVVTGSVLNVELHNEPDDGFDILVTVQIEESLKGTAPNDTIYIRQRNSTRLEDSRTRPEQNQRYLFLLSSGVYGYQSANYRLREYGEADVSAPNPGEENTFVIYRMYEFRNGEVYPSAYPFDTIIRQLKMVHSIVNNR